jgi:hypothetical protein
MLPAEAMSAKKGFPTLTMLANAKPRAVTSINGPAASSQEHD